MDIKTKVNQIAQSMNMDLDEFCSWLLDQRNDSNDIFKTIDGIVFKSEGGCRYYNFHAKFQDESDQKFVSINMFRD